MEAVTHILKLWDGRDHFQAMLDGRKKFDVRINDRRPRYAVGQIILYKEFAANGFTGRELKRRIIFVQPGYEVGLVTPYHGIRNGYAGLGLEEITDDTSKA